MNRTIARCLYGVLLAGGLTVFGATAAQAADTSGDDGVLSGTVVDTVVSVPATVGGNAVSVLGDSNSTDATASAAPAGTSAGSSTSGDDAIASGSQVAGAVSVPVTLGGNAVSVAGDSTSTDASTSAGSAPSGAATPATTSGDESVAGGSQVAPVATVPVTVGGNAISVLGDSSTSGSAENSSTGASAPAGSSAATTSGDAGVLSGTQVVPVITAPVGVGGNALSVVGDSSTTGSSTDGAWAPAGPSAATTSGDAGVLGGTQVAPAITAPVGVRGNAVSVVGDSTTSGSSTTDSSAPESSDSGGNEGVLSGTQVAPAPSASVVADAGTASVVESRSGGAALAASATLVAASAVPNLAETGSNGASVWLAFAAVVVLAGAAVTLLGRTHAVQRH